MTRERERERERATAPWMHVVLSLVAAAALFVPLACGDDRAGDERSTDPPVGKVASPAIAHDLSHKIETVNSGDDYIQECAAAGVPIPEMIADPQDARWIDHGEVRDEFESPQWEAELWSYEDPNVDGVCAALPRWDGSWARLFGVICLSRATGHICFWDNPQGVTFPRGQGMPITLFVGGFDLVANNQGTCSDCHAGENPFIVHPEYPAFEDFRAKRDLTPQHWPKPIVPAVFPGNPGPIDALGPVPSGQVRCDGCHSPGSGIRFPLPSNALGGYCSKVLKVATTRPTMPQGGGNGTAHTNWLLSLCNWEPITGEIVPVEDFEPKVLSPPILGPIHACSTQVLVSGLVYGASVGLEVDSTSVPVPSTATGPQMTVDVGEPLTDGQTVTAWQSLEELELVSDSVEEMVQDHHDLYPEGLPAPTIAPAPLYTCARSIASLNLDGGVELIFEKRNGGVLVDTYEAFSVAPHTGVVGLAPAFVLGDTFTVKQQICGEDPSDPSAEVAIVAAPTTIPAPAFVPSLLEGQQVADIASILQGAHVVVSSNSSPVIDVLSLPFDFWRNVDLAGPLGAPVTAFHNIALQQELCNNLGSSEIVVEECNPDELVAQIAPPVEGDTFVSVTQAVPGATIHVLATEGHIGMASGPVITLSRALVGGELIVVVEQLPGCMATSGFQIEVLDL